MKPLEEFFEEQHEEPLVFYDQTIISDFVSNDYVELIFALGYSDEDLYNILASFDHFEQEQHILIEEL